MRMVRELMAAEESSVSRSGVGNGYGNGSSSPSTTRGQWQGGSSGEDWREPRYELS